MKKSHHDTTSELELSHALEENVFIQWVTQHGPTVLIVVLASLVVLGIGYRFIGGGSNKAEADYVNAENDYVIFKRGIAEGTAVATPEEAFQRLQQILKARPDLESKYDGLLAQTLINRGNLSEAKVYADRTLARTSRDHLPLYADYAQTTLLIGQEQYKDALLKALQLKQQMLDAASAEGQQAGTQGFGNILFAFNLLRIAMLEQQVGTPEDELKAWQTLKDYAKGFPILQQHFEEGGVSLLNYIEAREKVLNETK